MLKSQIPFLFLVYFDVNYRQEKNKDKSQFFVTIHIFQTTRDFYIGRVAYSALIMFSETVMSKCLPFIQLTNTVLIFLLCQPQSFSLRSNWASLTLSLNRKPSLESGLPSFYAATFFFFLFFFTMEMAYILLLSLAYCSARRMYRTFLGIPYGNILPVYYSISSHTFYFLCPSGGELPYTVLRNLKTQFDLDILCSNTKLIFHLIVISLLEVIHGLRSHSLLKFSE